jgi:hypothetical protein
VSVNRIFQGSAVMSRSNANFCEYGPNVTRLQGLVLLDILLPIEK